MAKNGTEGLLTRDKSDKKSVEVPLQPETQESLKPKHGPEPQAFLGLAGLTFQYLRGNVKKTSCIDHLYTRIAANKLKPKRLGKAYLASQLPIFSVPATSVLL
jgi:hypothetical protein